MSITAKRPRWSKRWPLHRPFLSTLSEVLRFSVRPASVLPRKTGSSLFGVGRTARPVTASKVGARTIVQVGDRGTDAPWKARKTNFRFSLPSHRPWQSRLGPISTFPPSRRRFGDDALNSEQARPAVHTSFIDPKAPPNQRFFATHTQQRGGAVWCGSCRY